MSEFLSWLFMNTLGALAFFASTAALLMRLGVDVPSVPLFVFAPTGLAALWTIAYFLMRSR
jgi:hypothetical protein